MYFSCDQICPKPKSCAGGAGSKNPVQKNITKANCDRGSIVEMEECVKICYCSWHSGHTVCFSWYKARILRSFRRDEYINQET